MALTTKTPSVRTWFSDEIQNAVESARIANQRALALVPEGKEKELYALGFDAFMNSFLVAMGCEA